MMITVLERLMPTAAKLGWRGIAELSVTAGVVSWGVDKVFDEAKKGVTKLADIQKQKLEAKKAALLAQKQKAEQIVTEEVPAEEVKTVDEEKPKTSKKKNK